MKVTDMLKGRHSTYQLQELIGKGGNAVVYRGVNINTNTPVAIKKMTASNEATIKAWRSEVEVLLSLKADKNDCVVRYLDHMNSGRNMLLVEEFASGGTLQQMVRNTNGLKESQVTFFMYRVTRGLEYIHQKGVLHRDVKAANVLICDNNAVKLADFGLAAHTSIVNSDGEDVNQDAENAALGSVYWLAPEVARGEPQTYSSDIWALGCLCVELLTGKPPYFDRTPVNALYQLAESTVSPIPEDLKSKVSDQCYKFMSACLTREPENRPTASELIRYPWFTEMRVQQKVAELVEKHNKRLSASSHANEKETTVAADAAQQDNVAQWVESNLYTSEGKKREDWICTYLKPIVTVLTEVTPHESFEIIRAFAYADQYFRGDERCQKLFTQELGKTDLWNIKDLSGLCRASELGMLFCSLCEKQDPNVPQFAPTHPHALRLMLNCTDNVVSHKCTDALFRLLVSNTPCEAELSPKGSDVVGSAPNTSGASNSFPPNNTSLSVEAMEERKLRSLRRFAANGGLVEVRSFLESKCYNSLQENDPPKIGWATLDKLFHIINETDEKVEGVELHLWRNIGIGPQTTAAVSDDSSEVSSEEEPRVTTERSASSPHHGGGNNNNTEVDSGEANERWFLALIQGSRHGCLHAADLLLKFMKMTQLVNYTRTITKAGVSVAGTLVLLAANNSVASATRMDIIRTLPSLQRSSPRAATFLRDPKASLPLLGRVIKRDGSHTILGEEVLKSMCSLCEDEPMAIAASQSPQFCKAVLRCITNNWRNTTLFPISRRLYELLYLHSPRPSEFLPLELALLQPTEQVPTEVMKKVSAVL